MICKAKFLAVITLVTSVTWSFRNQMKYTNLVFKIFFSYYQCCKELCCLIFFGNQETYKKKKKKEILCNNLMHPCRRKVPKTLNGSVNKCDNWGKIILPSLSILDCKWGWKYKFRPQRLQYSNLRNLLYLKFKLRSASLCTEISLEVSASFISIPHCFSLKGF